MARRSFGVVLLVLGGVAAACGRVEQPLGNLPEQTLEPTAGTPGTSGRPPTSNQEHAGESAGGASNANQQCTQPLPFQCLEDCNDRIGVGAVCEDGQWACAPGDIAHRSCPPNTPGACHWELPPTCYDSCESGMRVETECVDRKPVCPKGSVTALDCPVESCISGAKCCDPNGVDSNSECDATTHQRAACPDGGRLVRGQCFPAEVSASSCAELENEECASPDWVCNSGCSTHCRCALKDLEATTLKWTCTHSPC